MQAARSKRAMSAWRMRQILHRRYINTPSDSLSAQTIANQHKVHEHPQTGKEQLLLLPINKLSTKLVDATLSQNAIVFWAAGEERKTHKRLQPVLHRTSLVFHKLLRKLQNRKERFVDWAVDAEEEERLAEVASGF